jgi:hypothetical protein
MVFGVGFGRGEGGIFNTNIVTENQNLITLNVSISTDQRTSIFAKLLLALASKFVRIDQTFSGVAIIRISVLISFPLL